MRIISWLKRQFKRPKRGRRGGFASPNSLPPLREFVYLDEASLRSLLSSQLGEMTDSTSEESMEVLEAEVSAALAANPALAKAELSSRFQTSNSSTIQTSRKATVQSWFREFHSLPGLRLIETTKPKAAADDLEVLRSTDDTSLFVGSSSLRRGALVEFRVRLKADPVFHLETMISEFSSMADDYPDMFSGANGLSTLRAVQPINKILQRLLAGLIPIRAEAVDYSVVVIDGVEYVVHDELVQGLDLRLRPLEIVGVTEHLAYWKDIRRVLFSDAEFTLLGRVARDGLDDTWTPVKLADLFRELVPGLVEQINTASLVPFGTPRLAAPVASAETQLGDALRAYTNALVAESGNNLSETERGMVEARVAVLAKRVSSVSDQRAAFRELKGLLHDLGRVEVSPERDLELRESSRATSGLSLFPVLATSTAKPPAAMPIDAPDRVGARLLDVEVIAVYW